MLRQGKILNVVFSFVTMLILAVKLLKFSFTWILASYGQVSLVPALPSRIKRVFYMSSEGQNLLHEVNVKPKFAVP